MLAVSPPLDCLVLVSGYAYSQAVSRRAAMKGLPAEVNCSGTLCRGRLNVDGAESHIRLWWRFGCSEPWSQRSLAGDSLPNLRGNTRSTAYITSVSLLPVLLFHARAIIAPEKRC